MVIHSTWHQLKIFFFHFSFNFDNVQLTIIFKMLSHGDAGNKQPELKVSWWMKYSIMLVSGNQPVLLIYHGNNPQIKKTKNKKTKKPSMLVWRGAQSKQKVYAQVNMFFSLFFTVVWCVDTTYSPQIVLGQLFQKCFFFVIGVASFFPCFVSLIGR